VCGFEISKEGNQGSNKPNQDDPEMANNAASACAADKSNVEHVQFGEGKTVDDFSCCGTLITAVPETDA